MTLRDIEKNLNKALGKGTVINLSDQPVVKDGLSSGAFSLNQALSGNPFIGYRWGRVVEIFGPNASGKTTFALHAIVEAQQLEHPCAFIDAEYALDIDYANALGINFELLSYSQPEYGEKAIETVLAMIENGYKLIVVDSVAALVPKAELTGDPGDAHMGKHAKLMSQALKMMVGKASEAGCIIIFLNQVRASMSMMGNPEVTSGGMALAFYSTYRLSCRSPRGGAQKEKSLSGDTEETGIMSNVTVVKNKVFPPQKKSEILINYGEGIDLPKDLATVLSIYANEDNKVVIEGNEISTRFLPRRLKEDPELYEKAVEALRGLI